MGKVQFNREAYSLGQESFLLMKKAIAFLLSEHPEGMKNADIGRALGVNGEHISGNDGWFQWTVLKHMELEGTVAQATERGPWRLRAFE